MALKYINGYIFEGQTFVTDKADIHNAKDDQFVEGTALIRDGWISVNDQLPNADKTSELQEFVPVLVFWNGKVATALYERDSGSGKTCYRWMRPTLGREFAPGITHWRPLPEPPEGAEMSKWNAPVV